MANLYLTEQNSILRKTGDRLIVQKDDEILLDVQCHKIDAVLIFGNFLTTTRKQRKKPLTGSAFVYRLKNLP